MNSCRKSHRRRHAAGIASLAALSLGALAGAQPVVAVVDPSESSITVSLTVSGFTDTDTSPVIGSLTVDPLDPGFPGDLLFHAYDLALLEPLNLLLSAGFFGSLTVNITDFTVTDAFQGQVFPAPLADGQFTLVDAPSELGGTLNYNASGLFCIALSGSNLPCADAQDLADQGVVFLTFSGQITIAEGVLTLASSIDASTPLDPENPSLGSITVTGQLVASGRLPDVPSCPADLNADQLVDADDLGILLGDFGCIGACIADLNNDGIVDADDLGILLGAFGTGC